MEYIIDARYVSPQTLSFKPTHYGMIIDRKVHSGRVTCAGEDIQGVTMNPDKCGRQTLDPYDCRPRKARTVYQRIPCYGTSMKCANGLKGNALLSDFERRLRLGTHGRRGGGRQSKRGQRWGKI